MVKAKKESTSKASKKGAAALKEIYYDVISRPVITEKATAASEHNKIIFRIRSEITKDQVKQAVEALFQVEVTGVNTLNVHGKAKTFRGRIGKRQGYKKAIVTLAKGQSIDLAAGVA